MRVMIVIDAAYIFDHVIIYTPRHGTDHGPATHGRGTPATAMMLPMRGSPASVLSCDVVASYHSPGAWAGA